MTDPEIQERNSADVRPRAGRLWLFRILAAVLAPALVLLALEGGLRLAGAGYETSFLRPVVGRPGVWTTNPQFGWRFFPRRLARAPVPFELRADPPAAGASRYRVFVVGGSAARGTPDSAYSFGRMLEVMLAESYPGIDFEVHNAAMTAINSHVTLPIVRDLARHDPDLFVVYLGNNEVVGPYGPATVFRRHSPNLALVRAGIALRRLRTGQILDRLLGRRLEDPGEWAGMEMFLDGRIAADDPRLQSIYRHLERNLTDMVRAAEGAGAPIVLSTVATNLRHQAPFASLHRPGLSEEEKTRWQRLFDAGLEAGAAGRHAEAVERLGEAAAVDDEHAELHFVRGRALFELGRHGEARDAFVRARDLDALRFRADSRVNDVIRRVAEAEAGRGAVLVDAEWELAARSPGGIPGGELFYEHVHPSLDGNHALARAVFEGLRPLLPAAAAERAGEPPPLERVAERLAVTPFDLYDLEREILQILSRPPFTALRGHAEAMARARLRLAERRRTLTPELWRASAELYRRQLESRPSDLELRRRFATLLQQRGLAAEALAQWEILLERLPGVDSWRLSRALALADADRVDEAVAELQALVRERPDAASLRIDLGTVLEKEERFDEAADEYRRAAALDPGDPLARFNLATLALRRGELDEAFDLYREIVAEHPGFAPAHHNLGHVHEKRGEVDQAIASYRRAVEAEPTMASARNSLALALESQGKLDEAFAEYQRAVAADPAFAAARFNLADLLFAAGRAADAEAQYRVGLALEPGNLAARYRHAGTLQMLGRLGDAAAELRRLLDEAGEHPGALHNLAWILATAEDRALRDPEEAVALAERAARATGENEPEILDTLAVAYRAADRPQDARRTLERALERARAQGREELAASLAERLANPENR